MEWELHHTRSVKLKKIQLRKIVILLALSAAPSMYASELSMMPFGVANPVRVDISFTTSTHVIDMGFSSADDASCGPQVAVSYSGGTAFALPPTGVVYFNGYLPRYAVDLCVATTGGTIALDGMHTNVGVCAVAGCYSYTCDFIGGNITSITPITPFTAACP
jgi:hypothetical protein